MRTWISWNVLFRLQETLKGHSTFAILREMEAADRMSVDQFEDSRNRRLKEFLAYGQQHVPYVRKMLNLAGVEPSAIRGPEDLRRLPLMTKADVRGHRSELRSVLAKDLTPFATGGSTGDPLIFDLSKRRIASRVACRARVGRWWGVSVGDPEIALWGSPIELTHQDKLRRLRDAALGSRLLSAFEMDSRTMSRYLDILESGRWRQVFAYPSAIYQLCQHAHKEGRNLQSLGIKVVFVTSEVLFPYQRELISETLNCPVSNGYGGRDSGFISHECPAGGMHILGDAIIVEILDEHGCPVPAGQAGQIVVTDLYSEESPFLRYATGDVGAFSTGSCSCGRPFPLLERIDGRSNDSIIAPDGRVINDQALVYVLRNVEGIEQFRIRQKRPDHFHVEILPNSEFSSRGEDRIRKGWTELLRVPLEVTFEYPPTLLPERSGKFRHVISEIGEHKKLAAVGDNPRSAQS